MSRIERKQAVTAAEAIKMFIRSSGLLPAHNVRRVFLAWDEASGAAAYTQRKFFRDGKLYVTMSSSVVRGQLSFQKQGLLEKVNEILASDELFIPEGQRDGWVKELILR